MLLKPRTPLSEALRRLSWVSLVNGCLFGLRLFECHAQERRAKSPAPISQVSKDAFYTQRDSIRFLTSVIKWPKSSLEAMTAMVKVEFQHTDAELWQAY